MPSLTLDFRVPETDEEIAKFIGLSVEELKAAIAAGSNPDSRQLYTRHRIPKKNQRLGQYRVVWDINDVNLRDGHRAFARRFEIFARQYIPGFPHECAYGYVRGRNIKENASQHLGQKYIFRCDLKDYFETINTERLTTWFKEAGVKENAANMLATFATIETKLALGLNASPLLANLISLKLDVKLHDIATKRGYIYSRYADDITFSGDAPPDEQEILQAIESEEFEVSRHKVRLTKIGQAHYVTGLSVSDRAGPHVPRSFKRRLRQELHYSDKFGIEGHLAKIYGEIPIQRHVNRIDGSIRFINSIEPALARRMQLTWNDILERESAHVSYEPVSKQSSVHSTFVVDETTFDRDGKQYLAISIVISEQVEKIRALTLATLREHMGDPFSGGKKAPLESKGLHFTDAPEALRTTYAQVLSILPIRGYVAFAELSSNTNYESLYIRLVKSLLPRRLMAQDGGTVTIVFERNDSVSTQKLSAAVDDVYKGLTSTNNRRPASPPKTEFKGKLDEPAFSAPDALLWIFRTTFEATDIKEMNYLRFERLRDKYRHIVNVDTGAMYSRRHPIELPEPKRGLKA